MVSAPKSSRTRSRQPSCEWKPDSFAQGKYSFMPQAIISWTTQAFAEPVSQDSKQPSFRGLDMLTP